MPVAPCRTNILSPFEIDTLQAFGFDNREIPFELDLALSAVRSTLSGAGDAETSTVSFPKDRLTAKGLLAATEPLLSIFCRRSTLCSSTNAEMTQRGRDLKVGCTE